MTKMEHRITGLFAVWLLASILLNEFLLGWLLG